MAADGNRCGPPRRRCRAAEAARAAGRGECAADALGDTFPVGPLPIRRYPDPILKERARPVEAVTPSLRRLAQAMVATMRAHPRCVGLAANQVGVLRRIIVLDTRAHPRTTVTHGLQVVINPVLVVAEGEVTGREGCLSLPGLTAAIARAARVVARGVGLDGEAIEIATAGFEAVVLQHEIDHLDGILILDRVRSEEDLFPRRRSPRLGQRGSQ